jgi:hypothetical protein
LARTASVATIKVPITKPLDKSEADGMPSI